MTPPPPRFVAANPGRPQAMRRGPHSFGPPPPPPLSPADTPGRLKAMRRGFISRCPACGGGRLFGKFLKTANHCEACGAEFHHHRADDFPPYVVIFIVGHIAGYGIYLVETRFEWPAWVNMAI